MIPFAKMPFVSECSTRLLDRAILLVAASLATLSCAVEPSSPLSTPLLPQPMIEADTTIQSDKSLVIKPILARVDLSYWHQKTSLPAEELEMYLGEWACGFVYREAVPSGQWVLVGVTKDHGYTPILDIYGDRTGNSTKNDTVYYHFQLVETD